MKSFENIKIAVAGTGYVGLSIATLLSQHHQVTAVDVIPEKVEKLNKRFLQFRMTISRNIFQRKIWTSKQPLMVPQPTRTLIM